MSRHRGTLIRGTYEPPDDPRIVKPRDRSDPAEMTAEEWGALVTKANASADPDDDVEQYADAGGR